MEQKLFKLLKKAYAPYSKVQVAAILTTKKNKEFLGVNIENAAYPSGLCAERVAIFGAISNGLDPDDIDSIHITSSLDVHLLPCAACLQVMTEFFKKTTPIILYAKGLPPKKYVFSDLLPNAVTKESFGWK